MQTAAAETMMMMMTMKGACAASQVCMTMLSVDVMNG